MYHLGPFFVFPLAFVTYWLYDNGMSPKNILSWYFYRVRLHKKEKMPGLCKDDQDSALLLTMGPYLKIKKILQMLGEMDENKCVHCLSQKPFLFPVSFFFFWMGGSDQ